ncbi:MAG: FHA domain-containing protein, partial [Phycisphaerae bacterium]|nr:FHA domain-containing protein [Phycisphaerae bacterium]
MASLTVIQGLDRGKTFEVEETDFVIGREPSCEIPLSDTSVSRHHARMVQTGKQLRIKDLGGVNGTFVNGARIADTAVEPGDQIRVGNTLLRLESTATAGLPDEDGGVIVDTEGNLVDSSIKATVRPEEAPHQVFAPGSGDVAEIRTALVGLQAIYKISDTIGSIRDVRELLKQIMDMVFDVVDADRGFIMITDEETGQMVPMAIRYREELIEEIQREQSGGDAKGTGGGKDQKSLPITVSHTIINYVMKRGEGVLSTNAMQDRRFADGESVHDFGIRSALCVPLKAHDRILGIIHVDMHISQGQFTEDDLRLMTAMGFQAGLAIENAHLMQATVEAERLAATGQAVASVSHYIKNILQGIQGGEHLLQTGLGAENLHKVEQGWEIIRRNQDRINNLVKNM